MIKKIGFCAICLTLLLSGDILGEGDCSGTSKGSSEKAGGVGMVAFEKGSVTILKETGSIVVGDNDGLVIQVAGPKEARTKKYQDVDLKDSDRVIMLNGDRVTTIKDFEEGYKAIEIGNDIELGVKRDKIMMIVSFPKASPDDLPKLQAMMISEEDGQIRSVETSGDNTNITAISSEGLTAIKPVPGAGLVVAEKEGNVTVMMILPNAGELMKENQLQEGDIIISLQGREVSSSEQFAGEYEEIPVGSKISIKYSRDGETGMSTSTKQETSGAMELKIEK
ncbi:MAG: PDZ domain-containing protein [Candidatus Zixiibacteriota bacterium]|nr:MAG: PDZ domain-containing protein [candidate division Zixibacteria bacterium]